MFLSLPLLLSTLFLGFYLIRARFNWLLILLYCLVRKGETWPISDTASSSAKVCPPHGPFGSNTCLMLRHDSPVFARLYEVGRLVAAYSSDVTIPPRRSYLVEYRIQKTLENKALDFLHSLNNPFCYPFPFFL
jgi:hypothetical protein